MALVTQEVGRAGSVVVSVTFDDVTGVVNKITGVNPNAFSVKFHFTTTLGGETGVIPAGANGGAVLLTNTPPALTKNVSDSTWDWDFTGTIGWQLDGD